MLATLFACVLVFLSFYPSPITATDPQVSLPYATYQGFHNSTSGLDVFLGVRYGASTEGQNRWREAQPPLDERSKGVVNATSWPKQCPQATSGGFINASSYNPLQEEDSEDCLFVNVYKDPNAEKQPVMVWIHGGSWDHNSAREFDPTPMITYSNSSFIGVIIQYRLGAFGFLASSQMSSSNGLNAGITDARAALRWVQEYIHLFGGDKDKVTIWGQSAGGGTIAHLLAAQGESERKGEKLWTSAVLSSPYVTPMGLCNSSYWQNQFHNFSAAANCTDNLECLRAASTDTLKTLSHQFDSVLQPGHPSAYQPCIEGEVQGGYLVHNTAERLKNGLIQPAYIIAGNNYADGSAFVSTSLNPPTNLTNISAEADLRFTNFLVADFPLTRGSKEVKQVLELYPLYEYVDNHARGAAVYQDVIFACPNDWILDKVDQGWRYLYAVGDAIHARDNAYEFPLFYNTLAPSSPTLYASYIGSVISLIISSPPNPNPASKAASDPYWPLFEKEGQYKVLNLTSPMNVSDSYIGQGAQQIGTKEKCDLWAEVRKQGGW